MNNYKQIDLLHFLRLLNKKRKLIVLSTMLFGVLGVLVWFALPKRYSSFVSFLPSKNTGSSSGQFQGIASIIGLDMPSSDNGEVSPFLYKDIVESIGFNRQLLFSEVQFHGEKMSYFEFLKTNYRPSFSEKIFVNLNPLNWFKGGAVNDQLNDIEQESPFIYMPLEDEPFLVATNKSINLKVNQNTGLMTLEGKAATPLIAAKLTQNAMVLLKKEVEGIKTKRLKHELETLSRNLEDKKANFESIQVELAKFRDTNKGLTSILAQTEEERLEYEYGLAFELYSQASKNHEIVQWQLLKELPEFSIINDIMVPNIPSSIGKKMAAVIYSVLGFLLTIVFIFFQYLKNQFFKASEP